MAVRMLALPEKLRFNEFKSFLLLLILVSLQKQGIR